MMRIEITIGNGNMLIYPFKQDGKVGVLFRPTEKTYDLGFIGTVGDEQVAQLLEPQKNDVIIWFENEEGLRGLQDVLSGVRFFQMGFSLLHERVSDI